MVWDLSFLFVLLAAPVVQPAPLGGNSLVTSTFAKRQQPPALIIPEVQTTALPTSQADNVDVAPPVGDMFESPSSFSSSTLATAMSAATLQREIHLVGEASGISGATNVLFLPPSPPSPAVPFNSSPSTLPVSSSTSSVNSDSAPPTSSNVITPVSATLAPASSTDTPTPTDSDVPSETGADTSGPAANPAFALHTPAVTGPLVSAYFPDWAASAFPPESIDMTLLDWIDFAFVTPDARFSLDFDDPSTSPGILTRLIKAAHAKGAKVKVSIGGWDGSK